jgi:hypothetical protein
MSTNILTEIGIMFDEHNNLIELEDGEIISDIEDDDDDDDNSRELYLRQLILKRIQPKKKQKKTS